MYGAFWSLLKILKLFVCPLPIKAFLTKGCSGEPKIDWPNTEKPNNDGAGTSSKTISAGWGIVLSA